ncbi:hypothetical protein GQ457_07G003660 [Hibiscus cannabinus]
METATHHETLLVIVFNSRADAWEFYKDYAKKNGFSVCHSTTRHDKHVNVKAQGFCCTRGGVRRKGVADSERKRATRAITRIGCKAKVIVKCTESGGFHNVGFIRKDMYNALQKTEAAELCDGDGNVYDRPLMLIVCANHNHQTIIFGVAILDDETVDTFKWVLREFLEAMGKKPHVYVVTDGDRAM